MNQVYKTIKLEVSERSLKQCACIVISEPAVSGVFISYWLLITELHSVNETGPYIVELVHDLGLELRCGAVCTKIRRIRVGHFDTTHAIVSGQWNCDGICDNIDVCEEPVLMSVADRLEQISVLNESKSRLIPSSEV